MIGITLVLFYVILILPMQIGNRRRRRKVEALIPGDEVVTYGGLVGRVVDIGDEMLTLEVSDGVHVRIMRDGIRSVLPRNDERPIIDSVEEEE
jgi:preprotein translocase subunit YajC